MAGKIFLPEVADEGAESHKGRSWNPAEVGVQCARPDKGKRSCSINSFLHHVTYGSTFPPRPRFTALFWEESAKTAAPHCTHFFFSFPLNLQFISHRARLLTPSDVVAAEVEPNNPPSSSSFLSSFSRSHWPCFSRALDVWIHCAFLSRSAKLGRCIMSALTPGGGCGHGMGSQEILARNLERFAST